MDRHPIGGGMLDQDFAGRILIAPDHQTHVTGLEHAQRRGIEIEDRLAERILSATRIGRDQLGPTLTKFHWSQPY